MCSSLYFNVASLQNAAQFVVYTSASGAGAPKRSEGGKREGGKRDKDSKGLTYEITVPDGVVAGGRLQATTPEGVKVKLVVPEGAKSGMLLTFQVPSCPPAVFARQPSSPARRLRPPARQGSRLKPQAGWAPMSRPPTCTCD